MDIVLKEKLLEDYKTSVKNRDYIRRGIVQVLRAEIALEEKYKKIDDTDIYVIIKKEIKKRKEVYPDYLRSKSELFICWLQKEMEILTSYLPKNLSEDELNKLIDNAIDNLGNDPQNMRKIIISVLNKAKGRADTKKIADMVNQRFK